MPAFTAELWDSALASTGLDDQLRLAKGLSMPPTLKASWTEEASFKLQYNPAG